jgi:hypothetical protein
MNRDSREVALPKVQLLLACRDNGQALREVQAAVDFACAQLATKLTAAEAWQLGIYRKRSGMQSANG